MLNCDRFRCHFALLPMISPFIVQYRTAGTNSHDDFAGWYLSCTECHDRLTFDFRSKGRKRLARQRNSYLVCREKVNEPSEREHRAAYISPWPSFVNARQRPSLNISVKGNLLLLNGVTVLTTNGFFCSVPRPWVDPTPQISFRRVSQLSVWWEPVFRPYECKLDGGDFFLVRISWLSTRVHKTVSFV